MSQDGGGRGRGGLLKLMETFCGDKESVGRGTLVDTTIGRGSIDLAKSSGRSNIDQVSIVGRGGIRQPSTIGEATIGRGSVDIAAFLDRGNIEQPKTPSCMDPSISLGRGRFIQESVTNTVIGFGRGGASGSDNRAGKATQVVRPKSSSDSQTHESSGSSSRGTMSPMIYTPQPESFRSSGSVKDVTAKMIQVEIKEESQKTSLEPSIKKGTTGHVVDVEVNYLLLNRLKDYSVYEYCVKFSPLIENKVFRVKMLKLHEESFGGTMLFDGSTMFLPMKLPNKLTTCTSKHPATEELVKLEIKFVKEKDVDDVVHIYNLLFKRVMTILKFIRLKDHSYNPDLQHIIPQHKLTVWPGFITTVSEVENGLMLMVDPMHRVLRSSTVLEEIRELMSVCQANEALIKKALIGRTVITSYTYKPYVVSDIKFDMSPTSTFKLHSGEDITFADYYNKTYLKIIKDLNQPILISIVKRRVQNSAEKEEQTVCLIPELCNFTGLTDKMRNNFSLMKDLALYTKITPNQRTLMLKKYIQNINGSPEATKLLSNWGISLDQGPVVLKARTLPPETIVFKNRKHNQQNFDANWSKETMLFPVIHPVDVDNWTILYTRRDEKSTRDFIDLFQRCGPPSGINVTLPHMEQLNSEHPDSYVRALQKAILAGVKFVMCIIPSNREDTYSSIKRVCYVENAVASQVVLGFTINKPHKLRPIAHKILLQTVCKLGGTLWSVPIPFQRLMVVGMDVFHSQGIKSVCGFVASYNKEVTRWYSRVCFQNNNQETVDQLERCMIEALKMFYVHNDSYPDRILIYRDGISTGAIEVHSKYELEQFKQAFKAISYDYNPLLSFIIVQKRINTRVYSIVKGGYDNPNPGTIVDYSITKKYLYDFFLVSHKVRNASLVPTHYIVIHDTSNMSPDHMQRITFKMCHLYYNWPGTIRVPAPCQYAHKLAYMVGCNLRTEHHRDMSKTLFFL